MSRHALSHVLVQLWQRPRCDGTISQKQASGFFASTLISSQPPMLCPTLMEVNPIPLKMLLTAFVSARFASVLVIVLPPVGSFVQRYLAAFLGVAPRTSDKRWPSVRLA